METAALQPPCPGPASCRWRGFPTHGSRTVWYGSLPQRGGGRRQPGGRV